MEEVFFALDQSEPLSDPDDVDDMDDLTFNTGSVCRCFLVVGVVFTFCSFLSYGLVW